MTAPANWRPPLAVGVTLVLWASAFVAIRHLKGDFGPGSLTLGRVLVGSLCLGAVALTQPMPRPTPRQWMSIATIGVLWFAIYNIALNEGEHHVDAGTAAMLLQVSPVLIALMATFVLREKFTTYLALGLAVAFAGVALIGLSTSPGGNRDLVGVVLCLLCALVYSISAVLQKPLVAQLPALHVTWWACTVGAIVCLPYLGELVSDTRAAATSSILWVAYLGVFPTAIAFTTYAYALRHMSASSLGVTTYLVPPITIVMGLIFLSETPPAVAYVGGALALIGVAIARRKPKDRTPAPAPTGG